jgi:ABC-type multidrug transport system ATPase subunit
MIGDILVDGYERSPATWKIQCAYVEQDDLLYRNLTVFETIRYAAMLRLPSSLSNEEKLERVKHIISVLGLEVVNSLKTELPGYLHRRFISSWNLWWRA